MGGFFFSFFSQDSPNPDISLSSLLAGRSAVRNGCHCAGLLARAYSVVEVRRSASFFFLFCLFRREEDGEITGVTNGA